jgi:hypothetical protein
LIGKTLPSRARTANPVLTKTHELQKYVLVGVIQP